MRIVKNKDLQRTDISSAKEVSRMDYIADDFAVSDKVENFQLFDFPTRLSDLAFGVCLRGSIEIEIDLKRHILRANHLIAILPEQIVQYINRSEDFSAQFVFMSRKFSEDTQVGLQDAWPLFFYIKEHPCTELTREEMSIMLEYISLQQKKVRMMDSAYRKEITRHLMQALFYEGGEICRKHFPATESQK